MGRVLVGHENISCMLGVAESVHLPFELVSLQHEILFPFAHRYAF